MENIKASYFQSLFIKIRSHSQELLAPIWLVFLGCITRLTYFGYPASVVFDETYTGKFLSNYWHHNFFFDVHPPLGRLLMLLYSHIIGADPTAINFDTIGNALPISIIYLRLLPIVCSILIPLIVYFIFRNLKFSKSASFVVGFFVVIENSLIVQGRFMLNDSMLVLFGFVAVLMYLLYKKHAEVSDNIEKNSKRRQNIFLVLTILFAAASFSVKWTGLLFTFFIVFLEFFRLYFVQEKILNKVRKFSISRVFAKRLVKFLFIYFTIFSLFYVITFAINFFLISHSGPGDAYMSTEFNKTLEGSPAINSKLPARGFIGKFFELNIVMFEMNNTLTKPHQYSSKWYTWPLMTRPIFYWQGDKGGLTSSTSLPDEKYIYLLGNPIIYWLGTLSVVLLGMVAIFFRKKLLDKNIQYALLFILAGFIFNFIPFKLIGRVMFLYHYEPALIFSIMAMVLLLELVPPKKLKKCLTIIFILLGVSAYVFFSPLTYGLPLSENGLKDRMWLSTWR